MYRRAHVGERASLSVCTAGCVLLHSEPDLGHICRQAGAMVMCGWRRVLEEC